MELSDALEGAAAVFRKRPAELLPFYLIGLAVPAIAQTVALVGLGLSYAYLEVTGRVGDFRDGLAAIDPPPLGAEPDPNAVAEWAEAVAPLLEQLFPPVVVVILVVTLLAAVSLAVLARAGASAGQIAVCYACFRDERPLRAGIGGVRRHWLAYLGLYVLELALWVALAALAVAVVAGATTASPIAGVVAGLAALWLWLVAVAVARALFAFAPAAVVVDETGVAGALRGSWGFIRAHPARAIIYYAIAIGSLIAFGLVLSAATVIESGGVVAPLGAVVIAPALDLVKVGLFAGHRSAASPPPSPGGEVGASVVDGIRRGVRELLRFVRATPGLHVIAIGLMTAGFATGWSLSEQFAGVVEASIAARLEGHRPAIATAQFFGNNWSVAVTTAFAGVALAVPAAVTLWFNGLVFGSYFRLEANPVELAAFVLPHGVIEIPAIVVAGATGLSLGRIGWRAWRGRCDRNEFADALERAFWIAIGLGAALLVAAVVEGFVSPYYYRIVFY